MAYLDVQISEQAEIVPASTRVTGNDTSVNGEARGTEVVIVQ